MNMKLRLHIIVIGLTAALLCVRGTAFAAGGLSGKIAEGNKLYADGKYDKALTEYNDAQIDSPLSPEIFFNMGDVFFRQGKYKEAVESYQKSMEKGDIDVEAKAMYNIGNAFFNQGRLREALEYYKQALERDPDDADTKYNIEYTEREIKEMLSKAKSTAKKAESDRQKKEGEQGAQGYKEKEGENFQKKEGQAAGAEKGEKEKAEKKDKGVSMSPAEKKEAGNGKKKDGNKEGRAAEAGDKNKGELSKKDAQRFLSAFERNKKNNKLMNQRKSTGGRGYYVEKDW